MIPSSCSNSSLSSSFKTTYVILSDRRESKDPLQISRSLQGFSFLRWGFFGALRLLRMTVYGSDKLEFEDWTMLWNKQKKQFMPSDSLMGYIWGIRHFCLPAKRWRNSTVTKPAR